MFRIRYVATAKNIRGRGIGAALYEFVRDESLGMSAEGLFFECLPDDPENCSDTDKRKQNQARMRFYERYGARPIVGTGYETPLPGGTDSELPHLMYDGLDQTKALSPEYARPVVQAVLERKYSEICTPDYIRKVVRSFGTSMKLRDFRYIKSVPILPPAERHLSPIAMTVNDRHDIHHIRERGYVESPVRIKAILSQLEPSGLVETMAVKEYPLKHIKAVHDPEFVEYLRRACANAPENTSVYPYVFPIRNATRPPKELSVRAGYYCIDTFTPINRNAWPAARRAVDCTLAAADQILEGRPIAYALVRPPGHHAERRSFGGFCYFNNAAVAAHYLSQFGKVAMLDIDYHHGNGQQDIFYSRSDVLTVSIHGDPDFAYPYFTGFADERGEGEGEGFNLNIPLPVLQDGEQYRRALKRAIAVIKDFRPTFLVVPLGLDPAKGDPTGTWTLNPADFEENARLIAGLELPALVVQEGGYRTRTLGTNARHFFKGLTSGAVGFRVVH
ncbi:MAG: acetylpolyamine amidohydrolase [Planctomycetota bacterium]|nr:acetylpolyamine amidohydrolase [Planctomycetota bacterium]